MLFCARSKFTRTNKYGCHVGCCLFRFICSWFGSIWHSNSARVHNTAWQAILNCGGDPFRLSIGDRGRQAVLPAPTWGLAELETSSQELHQALTRSFGRMTCPLKSRCSEFTWGMDPCWDQLRGHSYHTSPPRTGGKSLRYLTMQQHENRALTFGGLAKHVWTRKRVSSYSVCSFIDPHPCNTPERNGYSETDRGICWWPRDLDVTRLEVDRCRKLIFGNSGILSAPVHFWSTNGRVQVVFHASPLWVVVAVLFGRVESDSINWRFINWTSLRHAEEIGISCPFSGTGLKSLSASSSSSEQPPALMSSVGIYSMAKCHECTLVTNSYKHC